MPTKAASPSLSTTKAAKPVMASTASTPNPQRKKLTVSQTPTMASLQQRARRDVAIPKLSLNLTESMTPSPLTPSEPLPSPLDLSPFKLPSAKGVSYAATPRGTTSSLSTRKASGHKRAASGSESGSGGHRAGGRRAGKGRKSGDRKPSEHRRTRSLSATREDTSWISGQSADRKQCRIRRGMDKQRRLDFAALMNRDSLSKKERNQQIVGEAH